MAERERLKAEIKPLIEIRATPEIERAIAEQMHALPEAIKLGDRQNKWNCFGLIACCNSLAAAIEPR